jgi:hypothetical protein
LGKWTIDTIYDLLSGGSPGADGITSDDFYLLGDDSLNALVELLNLAELG